MKARWGRAVRILYSSPSTERSVEAHACTVARNSDWLSKHGVGKGTYLEVMSDRYAGRRY